MANDIFITSNNQTGGITAHTVNNFAPPARKMDEATGKHFLSIMPKTATVNVYAAGGDSEANLFANQILQWLQTNGYSLAWGIGQRFNTVPQMGQEIAGNPEGTFFEIFIGHQQT
jgi:hypothetical protein